MLWSTPGGHYDRDTCKMADQDLKALFNEICDSSAKHGNSQEKVAGDVNADGEFSVSDLVIMQKWLLAVPGTELPDWKAGDLCEDDVINAFDLCIMRGRLVKEGAL